jgi:hypothetical protein
MAIDSLRHAELDPPVASKKPGFEGRQRRPPSTGSRGSRDSRGSASDLTTWRWVKPLRLKGLPFGYLTMVNKGNHH